MNENLLYEILKGCFTGNSFLETIKPHLKYSFLPTEPYKKIFKALFDYHTINGRPPTIGIISQDLENDSDVNSILSRVKNIDLGGRKDLVAFKFEEFIKHSSFQDMFYRAKDLFSEGKKEQAISLVAKESEQINRFSMASKVHGELYGGFMSRHKDRQGEDQNVRKIPTGIPQFDYHTRGGLEFGTSLLVTARSGIGKSFLLRFLAFQASIRGFNVVHFQAEGTEKECYNYYDSMWTGIPIEKLKIGELGDLSPDKMIEKVKKFKGQCGRIFVIAFEQFDSVDAKQCRDKVAELMGICDIHMAVFDYVDKIHPGDGIRYGANNEKQRKKASSDKLVNISTEFNIVVATATQCDNVPKDLWNDPTKVIDRSNISNDKETIQPYAYHLTLNQTIDEKDSGVIRIHEDKIRHNDVPSWESTYKVQGDRGRGMFLSIKETNNKFWDKENKKIKNHAPVKKST